MEGELTVDQLAARVKMTVRNVRAYAARGLLPPPRLEGRTGFYGREHVARLTLVRELLDSGLTLAAVQRRLEGAPSSASASALALHRAMMAPWLPEEPQVVTLEALREKVGVDADGSVLAELEAMGVVELLDDERVRVLDTALLEAGVQVVRLGVPPEAVVEAQRQVVELVEQAAEVYVRMFHSTVWQRFVDRGAPADGWDHLQATVEALQPVAAQALLASFRSAMAATVADELQAALDSGGVTDAAGGPRLAG